MTDVVPLILPRRSVAVLLDMIDNRLTSINSVDREDAREVRALMDAQRAITQAKGHKPCNEEEASWVAGLK